MVVQWESKPKPLSYRKLSRLQILGNLRNIDVLVWQEVRGIAFPAIEVMLRMLLEAFLYMCIPVYICVCIRMLLQISIYLYVYACVYMCLYECLCGCINT